LTTVLVGHRASGGSSKVLLGSTIPYHFMPCGYLTPDQLEVGCLQIIELGPKDTFGTRGVGGGPTPLVPICSTLVQNVARWS
jgi:hypothetical protein